MRSLVLLVFIVPGAMGAPLLHAVVPDLPGPGPGDEGFAVHADGQDLSGWMVTDGEGTWELPGCNDVCWFTGNLDLWYAHDGPPASQWDEPELRLSNDGEWLRLLDPNGNVVDEFAWGSGETVSYRSAGAVYQRMDDGWVTPRIHRIGETQLDQPTFTVDQLTLYASPDSSYAVLRGLIDGAADRLHLHVHDLRHRELIQAMADAASRGVDVQVLVDGNVVGRSHEEEAEERAHWAVIQAAGGDVEVAERGRYVHHHLKVLVADDAVAVQSENWNPSGVPVDSSWGNRGWGMVVHDPAATDWFASWMADDREAWDVEPLGDVEPSAPPAFPVPTGNHFAVPPQELQGMFTITPLVSPDHTAYANQDVVLQRMANAQHRILGQQLRMDTEESNALGWSGTDRYMQELIVAEARGVDVQMLLAAPFHFTDTHNADVAEALQFAGAEARLWELDGTLHNKGWIIDDAVVLGSMNGNHASRSANREVGLLVEGDGVADWYAERWQADMDAHSSLFTPWPMTPVPMLLAIMAVARACRPSRC